MIFVNPMRTLGTIILALGLTTKVASSAAPAVCDIDAAVMVDSHPGHQNAIYHYGVDRGAFGKLKITKAPGKGFWKKADRFSEDQFDISMNWEIWNTTLKNYRKDASAIDADLSLSEAEKAERKSQLNRPLVYRGLIGPLYAVVGPKLDDKTDMARMLGKYVGLSNFSPEGNLTTWPSEPWEGRQSALTETILDSLRKYLPEGTSIYGGNRVAAEKAGFSWDKTVAILSYSLSGAREAAVLGTKYDDAEGTHFAMVRLPSALKMVNEPDDPSQPMAMYITPEMISRVNNTAHAGMMVDGNLYDRSPEFRAVVDCIDAGLEVSFNMVSENPDDFAQWVVDTVCVPGHKSSLGQIAVRNAAEQCDAKRTFALARKFADMILSTTRADGCFTTDEVEFVRRISFEENTSFFGGKICE